MEMLSPLRMRGLLIYLPQFVWLFARLMVDRQVPLLAKLATVLGLLLLFTPPAIELDFVPVTGQLDWLLVAYFSLQLFIWLCPADVVRENVTGIAPGGLTS
jgi:hypothetical protein